MTRPTGSRRSLWSYRRQVSMVWRCSAHGVFLVVGMKVLGTPLGIGSLVAGAVGLAVAVAILLMGCAAARRRA